MKIEVEQRDGAVRGVVQFTVPGELSMGAQAIYGPPLSGEVGTELARKAMDAAARRATMELVRGGVLPNPPPPPPPPRQVVEERWVPWWQTGFVIGKGGTREEQLDGVPGGSAGSHDHGASQAIQQVGAHVVLG